MINKALKHLKEIVSKIKEFIVKEEGEFHHEEPIPVDPPIKPKEEEK